MPSNYSGLAGNVTAGSKITISQPIDGDPDNGAAFQAPYQTTADYVEYLLEQVALNQLLTQTAMTTPAAFNHACSTGFAYTSAGVAQFVGVGASGAIYSSPNSGGPWTSRTSNVTAALNAVASSGSLLVAVGAIGTTNPVITTSPDGITWTARTNAATVALTAVCWAPALSLWVAVGSNTCLTSPDGITWTARTIPANNYTSVAFGNSVLVAASSAANTVATSPDGITWTSRASGGCSISPAGLWFASNAGVFVSANSTSGSIFTSPDGITWTSRATPAGASNYAFTTVGRVIVGYGSQTLGPLVTSPDGVTWKLRTISSSVTPVAGSIPISAPSGALLLLAPSGTTQTISGPSATP